MALRDVARNARTAIRTLRYGAGQPLRRPEIAASAQVLRHRDVRRTGGRLAVGENSTLQLNSGVQIDADLLIGRNCRVMIGAQSRLSNTIFRISDGATVELGEGVILEASGLSPNLVVVDNGHLVLADCVRIQAEILVRFGGRLTIGRYTGIGHGSEIRCEERVDIGAYGLFSYEVCIYDTNTHSTDWQSRRRMIERMYATGMGEDHRPDTRPVRIGDDVWIGKGATILKGSQIGDRCIVGIRTVVGGNSFPADAVIVSPPPRVLVG